jgi:hypothetical protein
MTRDGCRRDQYLHTAINTWEGSLFLALCVTTGNTKVPCGVIGERAGAILKAAHGIRAEGLWFKIAISSTGSANQAVVFYRRSRGSSPSDSKSSSCPRKRCPHRLNSFFHYLFEEASLALCSVAGKCAFGSKYCTQFSELAELFVLKSRTETDASKKDSVIFVLISRTNFSRNFVRVLCATSPGFQCSDNAVNSRKRIENKQA